MRLSQQHPQTATRGHFAMIFKKRGRVGRRRPKEQRGPARGSSDWRDATGRRSFGRRMITTHPNDRKERLSVAYLTAIAAGAGCQISKLEIDKQSIDATIRPISGPKLLIDVQLKATSVTSFDGDQLPFDLPVNNYEALRATVRTAPHYLVVLLLDPDDGRWLDSDHDALTIRRCAYWLDLTGAAATDNSDRIRVWLTRHQPFDVAALEGMLGREHVRIMGAPA